MNQRWKFKPGDLIEGGKSSSRIIAQVTESRKDGEKRLSYKLFCIELKEFKTIDKDIMEIFYEKAPQKRKR